MGGTVGIAQPLRQRIRLLALQLLQRQSLPATQINVGQGRLAHHLIAQHTGGVEGTALGR
ncbi:hypothetical protein D3C81_2295420 [compost metagenome]